MHAGGVTPAAAYGQDADRGGSGNRPSPQEHPSVSNLQAACSLVTSCCSDLVELNVGGTLFTINRTPLEESQPPSMLAALVRGRHGLPRCDAKVRDGEQKGQEE